MTNYIVARMIAIIPTLLLLLFFVVVLVRLLPGNAADILLAENRSAGAVTREDLEKRMGLDKPLPQEYVEYTGSALRGDLGRSLWTQKPVAAQITDKLGVTLELASLALLAGTVVGVTLGVVSAVSKGSLLDYALRSLSVIGLSVPIFAVATMLVVLPVYWWRWSPPLTYSPWSAGAWPHISQYFAPAFVLALSTSGVLMRLTRTAMLEVLSQDYIRTARAKGLRGGRVVTVHGLRNALIPILSLLGVQVSFLISGTVIVESVFGLPGLGRELLGAISSRDYPMVQGITIFTGSLVIVTNLAVDFSYGIVDPRLRRG